MNFSKKTKIVATISDKRCDVDFLTQLYKAGMNVVRLNTAHQTVDEARKVIDNVRKVSEQIAVLVDTKGPEMRTTAMKNGSGFTVNQDDVIIISGSATELSSEDRLYINYPNFVNDVPVGAIILIDDGEIALKVTDKTPDYLLCTVQNAGKIGGRKSVNVPSVHVKLPSLTNKDIDFINWAIDNEVDFIAHSFVRNVQDVADVQRILDERQSHIKIIAKIENQQGVDNIDDILGCVYGIMIARGDLGVEIEAEKIPDIQRMLLRKCRERKKPVIIATQMLHSMIEHPRPTRAEVSDVANAIYQRTDAIMLSGETAYGIYPLEAVKTMSRIALEIESHLQPETDIQLNNVTEPVAATLARSAVEATLKLPIKAIVIDTLSGRTGRYIAAFRPSVPIFAKCYKSHSMRELALSYGVYASVMAPRNTKDEFEHEAVGSLLANGFFGMDDRIVVIGGSFGPTAGATFIEISPAGTIVK